MDNFFNSPTLLEDLYRKETHSTGTLSLNHVGIPADVSQLNHSIWKVLEERENCLHRMEGHQVRYSGNNWTHRSLGGNSDPQLKRKRATTEKECPNSPFCVKLQQVHGWGGCFRSNAQVLPSSKADKKYWKTFFFFFILWTWLWSTLTSVSRRQIPQAGPAIINIVRTLSLLFARPQHLCTHLQDPVVDLGKTWSTEGWSTSVKIANCLYCKIVHGRRRQTTQRCAKCKVPLCFVGDNQCCVKYHLRNFARTRKDLGKQRKPAPTSAIEITPKSRSRPVGSFKLKGQGRGRRRSGNYGQCTN